MHSEVIQIGNSLGLRLPKAMLDALDLGKSSKVSIREIDGTIVVRPEREARAGWAAAFAAHPAIEENLWGDLPPDEGWDQ